MTRRLRLGLTIVVGLLTAAAHPAAAQDTPVIVDRSQFGWIDTEVTDVQLSAVRPATRRPAHTHRTCTQTKSATAGGYATEEQFESGAAPDANPGGWVVRRCSDGTLDTAWVAARPVVRDLVNPQRLALRAVNRLPLPLPVPSFEPRRSSSAGPATLVAIPTSFFLDGWRPVSQRTAAGGEWAVVTARPVATTWWPGDGTAPVRCEGAGRVRTDADSAASRCTHTYRRSSAAELRNVYTARVSVTWRVSWRGSRGSAGTLPLMQRQATFPVAVAERQTVVVQGGEQ